MEQTSSSARPCGSPLLLLPSQLQELVVKQLDVAGKYALRATCSRLRNLVNASVATLHIKLRLRLLSNTALHLGRAFPNVETIVLVADFYRSSPCPKLLALMSQELPELTALRTLDLQRCTPITKDLIAAIREGCPQLEKLVLPPTKPVNASEVLETVALLPNLSDLHLCRAGVRCCCVLLKSCRSAFATQFNLLLMYPADTFQRKKVCGGE